MGKGEFHGGVLMLLFLWVCGVTASVTYDHKAIVIDGKRRILISGSIHYPRSTPQVHTPLQICIMAASKFVFSTFSCICFIFFFPFSTHPCILNHVCYCRCGRTLFKRPKMEALMSFRPMFFGMVMNLLQEK